MLKLRKLSPHMSHKEMSVTCLSVLHTHTRHIHHRIACSSETRDTSATCIKNLLNKHKVCVNRVAAPSFRMQRNAFLSSSSSSASLSCEWSIHMHGYCEWIHPKAPSVDSWRDSCLACALTQRMTTAFLSNIIHENKKAEEKKNRMQITLDCDEQSNWIFFLDDKYRGANPSIEKLS